MKIGLDSKISSKYLTIGIQGGLGSFNEQAVNAYLHRHTIKNSRIRFLFTSEKVLSALDKGEIDMGQFAIHNAIGGMVTESLQAISHHLFEIVEEYPILITHHLMKRKEVLFSDIDTIMAHDQVFKQCKSTLTVKYPALRQISGTGDLADTAAAAKALAEGSIPKTTAILGPKILATHYNFDIIESDLQDMKENYTTFLMVKRIT